VSQKVNGIFSYTRNKMCKKRLLLIPFLAALASCSTTPVSQDTARNIPPDRIYDTSYVGPAVKTDIDSTLLFLRDSGFFGSGCTHDIYIDNLKIFAIRQGEQMTIHVPSGKHFIRLETGGGICPNIATSQNIDIQPGFRETYRILLPSDGSLRLTRIE